MARSTCVPFPKRPLLRALGWAHTTNYLALQNLAKNDQSKAFSFLKESKNITIYLKKYNKYEYMHIILPKLFVLNFPKTKMAK